MALTKSPDIAENADHISLTEKAYHELEERIVTLRLLPGSVLSEGILSRSLGIGRTPIREALQQLSREGLVAVLPRRGVLVSELNVKDQLELLKVRREVERLMCRLCAERGSDAELQRFAEIASSMRRCASNGDDVAFIRLDREFDLLVALACRNEFARRTMSLMMGLSRRFWYMHYRQANDLPTSCAMHADIAEAIAAKDGGKAAKACDAHIDYAESFTRASLDFGVR
jgi:DNA-binding GntR family transcriptional regulator